MIKTSHRLGVSSRFVIFASSMSYNKLIYHLTFSTKLRERTIEEKHEKKLYAYITGIVRNSNGYVHAISGMEDHIHIMLEVPPTMSISDYVKMIKQRSSAWLKESTDFPRWGGWNKGYAIFTCSPIKTDGVIGYIRNQKKHHQRGSYEDELRNMLLRVNIDYDERQMR